jgi:hypothetical protein
MSIVDEIKVHAVCPKHIVRLGPDAMRIYTTAIANGGTPAFAEMCATQTPPGTRGTDRTMMEGRLAGQDLDTLPKRQADRIVREARAAGISIAGKTYMSGIANKKGHLDPRAWVSSVAEVKQVCRERGLSIRGCVNYDAPETAPPKRVALNPKLERRLIKQEMAENPGLTRGAAKERVWDKYVPAFKKKGK